MAFIIENSERYVKVVKNLSADGVVATMIEYKDKNTRILEKQFGSFKTKVIELVDTVLDEYYESMFEKASQIGFSNEDVESEAGVQHYRTQHPTFDSLYLQYHTLFDEQELLTNFFRTINAPTPNLPIIFSLVKTRLTGLTVETEEQFNFLLASSSPETITMSVLLNLDQEVSLEDLYIHLKETGVYTNVIDDL